MFIVLFVCNWNELQAKMTVKHWSPNPGCRSIRNRNELLVDGINSKSRPASV